MRNIAMLGDRGLSNSSNMCSSSQDLHRNIQACSSDARDQNKINQSISKARQSTGLLADD
jgi:hypothetical protein